MPDICKDVVVIAKPLDKMKEEQRIARIWELLDLDLPSAEDYIRSGMMEIDEALFAIDSGDDGSLVNKSVAEDFSDITLQNPSDPYEVFDALN